MAATPAGEYTAVMDLRRYGTEKKAVADRGNCKFPGPPFQGQKQPWPGLASKMNPKPDHGETSYRGSGRLAGRKALITGGDSGMGRAIFEGTYMF